MWMFLVGVGVRFGNLLCGGFLGGFYGCRNTVACGGFGGSGLGVSGCVGNCTCYSFVFGVVWLRWFGVVGSGMGM